MNSKRVTPKPSTVSLNAEEELSENENDDYIGESYSFYKTIPQPTLPNAYDQEEFHSVVKNKRKLQRPLNPYFERDERVRTTTRKPTVTLRIPDEDYVDDLVKVVQTTKRPKKKLPKPTTTHVLDTEDLREAYDSDVPYYPSSKSKQNNNKGRNRYPNQQSHDYDNNEDDDDNYDDYENDRVSHVSSNGKEEKSKRSQDKDLQVEQSSLNPSYWDKDSSIYKQYGIKARNDDFHVSNVQLFSNGFRPIRDRSDVFVENPIDSRSHYLHDIGIVADNRFSSGERIASTLSSVTTPKPSSTLYVWDGKQMPKNHKMV